MKLTISRKLLAGYLAMALLAILASAYAIFSLYNLNELAYSIIDEDFFVVDTGKKMMDALLAQESAEKRYLILKDPSIAELFWSRSHDSMTASRISGTIMSPVWRRRYRKFHCCISSMTTFLIRQ
jgi:hypothetical protein